MAEEDYAAGTYSKLAEVAQQKKQPPLPQTPSVERTQNISKPSNRDTVIPSNQATNDTTDYIEVVRKAVKQLGKEAATYRFTQEEKSALADIVYSLKTKGMRSSENEITRIAINYLVWEYRHSKQASILSQVLERLNA